MKELLEELARRLVDEPDRVISVAFTSVIDAVALDIGCSQREIDARPLIAVIAR